MPLYSDQGYYYSGGSSQLYAPYYTPGLYSSTASSSSSGAYAPYSSTYNRTFGGSYILPLMPPRTPSYTTTHSLSSRYQPKLCTITETSPLISSRHGGILPLTRIQSPKVSSYSAPSSTSKYIPPRPIPINTADIDVSSKRYMHHNQNAEEEASKKRREEDELSIKRDSTEKKSQSEEQEETTEESHRERSTIKRDRPVVRLSTIRSRSKGHERAKQSTETETDGAPQANLFKDLPTIEQGKTAGEKLSWRQKLADELAAIPVYPTRKSPGDLIRERYLMQEASKTDDFNYALHSRSTRKGGTDVEGNQSSMSTMPIEQVVVELDPIDHSIRRLSIPHCPSFHDICEDISSDKIDDDLNAGALRRRASLIQEQEQEFLNQLQKSQSGNFQLIHLERRDSLDSQAEEEHRQSSKKRKSKKGKKIRHKITAVVDVENAQSLPVLQEREEPVPTPKSIEPAPKPKFTFNVDTVEEHHEIQTVFKLPKRKSIKKSMAKVKEVALPEGFMHARPKAKTSPIVKTPKKQEVKIRSSDAKAAIEDKDESKLSERTKVAEQVETSQPMIKSKETEVDFTQSQPVIPSTENREELKPSKTEKSSNDKIEEQVKEQNVFKPTVKQSKVSLEKSKVPLKTSQSLDNAIALKSNKAPTKNIEKSQSLSAAIENKDELKLSEQTKVAEQVETSKQMIERKESEVDFTQSQPVIPSMECKTEKASSDTIEEQVKEQNSLKPTSKQSKVSLEKSKVALKTSQSLDNASALKIDKAPTKNIEKSQSLSAMELKAPQSPLNKPKLETAKFKTIQEELNIINYGNVAAAKQNATSSIATAPKTESKSPTPQPELQATPKPIQRPLSKSESGEDFWAQIGTRESFYMTNRKKNQLEGLWQKREELLQSPEAETVHKLDEIKMTVNTQMQQALQRADEELNKSNVERSQSTDSTLSKSSTQTKIEQLGKSESLEKAKTSEIAQKLTLKSKTSAQYHEVEETPKTSASPILPTTTSSTALAATGDGTPKINSGHAAKSPEQQRQRQDETEELATTSTANNKNNVDAGKTLKTTPGTKTSITTTKTEAVNPSAISPPPTPTTTTNLASISQPTTATLATNAAITATKLQETKPSIAEADKKSPVGDSGGVKTKTPATSTTPTTPIVTVTPTVAQPKVGGKAAAKSIASKASPASAAINADQFIIAAPAKSVTSPTKNKIKTSPLKKIATKTTTATAEIGASSKTKSTTTTAKSAPTTTTTATAAATVTNAAATTIDSATTIATTASTTALNTTTITSVATSATTAATAGNQKSRDFTQSETLTEPPQSPIGPHAPNNLSKFATVQNLAQCLQDVDADLADYIPSSAENSDDDVSTDDYSSADGCDYKNLSASMKKKLRQRRKQEKLAEKARFDPQKKIKIDPSNKCYVKEEAPRYPLVATPRPLWKREKIVYPAEDSDDDEDDENSDSEESGTEETDSEDCTTSEEYEDDLRASASGTATGGSDASKENSAIIRLSTCSNDSGFEGGTAPSSPKKMLECDVNCHKKCEHLMANLCGVNQKLIVEALACVKRDTSYTYSQFQKSGRFTAPATVIPRFKNYSVDDFHFLAVLGKGSFGKVLLAELRDTTYYYAVKCLKKDVVLEDDDVDSTLIERKVLALGTKHPYLCHLFCTFQTESHLFFVMEYLNGGDLMFHIQESGRFSEERARFYGAEIISGLKFLHKKGIIYRDLKLDNVLLDYEGHVRIADFGMCKLQIYLDKTADSFCGTPDYMAPEIIKGEKYNQNVDWWSFGVLLYEMLIGQSPFSGCDEDELFWSICNEIPWFPVYISAEATGILRGLLEKDYTKRIGSQYSPAGDISDHLFFRPIDWKLLEKRQLEPPFKPQVKHPLDTQYFDRVFTKERVRLTPIDREILQSMDQKPFLGFTYTNPHITLE